MNSKQESIRSEIVQAIREARFLRIRYRNRQGELTDYWICVMDVLGDLESPRPNLQVEMYNVGRPGCISGQIYFGAIEEAHRIDFTTYDVPRGLIRKLESNMPSVSWLGYDRFDNGILRYYEEASDMDVDPSQKSAFLVEGIDLDLLRRKGEVQLNDEQVERVVRGVVIRYGDKRGDPVEETYRHQFAISECSIDKGDRKYVVSYFNLAFDPRRKSLRLVGERCFNATFLARRKAAVEGTAEAYERLRLEPYIEGDVQSFIDQFNRDPSKGLNVLRGGLFPGEVLNTRPEIMILERRVTLQLFSTYQNIEREHAEGREEYPADAFFGNVSRSAYNHFRKEPNLVVYDSRTNLDQVCALYDALRYPVTYVQGPPGTGKTQILINLALSALVNDRTLLICASNNKPVDSILRRLDFGYYTTSDMETVKLDFPYIRLGNNDVMAEALNRILTLYNTDPPDADAGRQLNYLVSRQEDRIKRLRDMVKARERKIELGQQLDSLDREIECFKGTNIEGRLREKRGELQAESDGIREYNDEDVISVLQPSCDDPSFQTYLYAEFAKRVHKLRDKRYSDLIAIAQSTAEDRIPAFNRWLADDSNMKLLTDVFPLVLCTLPSLHKLGTGRFKFDHVAVDEAGQALVASGLLAVARARNLVLLGDESQLQPVVTLDPGIDKALRTRYGVNARYSYRDGSLLSIMKSVDNLSKRVFLRDHYRCAPKIATFANKRFYDNRMILKTRDFPDSLVFIPVHNRTVGRRNANPDEAAAVVDYLADNGTESTSVISPFVNQCAAINQMLKSRGIDGLSATTIHSMQGNENDTVILSLSISERTLPRTAEWLESNREIINVAVTRPRKKLVICADREAIADVCKESKDATVPLLVEYVLNRGNIEVPTDTKYAVTIGYSNDSAAEDEFYRTISHLCTMYPDCRAERNVLLRNILPSDPGFKRSLLEADVVVYFGKKPFAVIEIDGPEHMLDGQTIARDARKTRLLEEKGIFVYRVPNVMVKEYEDLKEHLFENNRKKANISVNQLRIGEPNKSEISSVKRSSTDSSTSGTHRSSFISRFFRSRRD